MVGHARGTLLSFLLKREVSSQFQGSGQVKVNQTNRQYAERRNIKPGAKYMLYWDSNQKVAFPFVLRISWTFQQCAQVGDTEVDKMFDFTNGTSSWLIGCKWLRHFGSQARERSNGTQQWTFKG